MAQILENSLLGGGLILAAAVLRRLSRGRASPNVALALWALCLVRLLTPVALPSPVSLYGLVAGPEAPAVTAPADIPEAERPGEPERRPGAGYEINITQQTVSAQEPQKPPERLGETDIVSLVYIVYITITAFLAALMLRAWFRVRRRVLALPEVARVYVPECLPGRARLRVGTMTGAPLTFGVVRPSVVVPPGIGGETLECVLAHEAVHARRGDNLWHYAAALAVCVHWFNPAVWLMAALIRRDVELSCDRAVVAGAGSDIRARYADTIISLSSGSGAAFASGFGRKKTEERIVAIMTYKKMTLLGLLAAALLAGTLALTLGGSPVRAAGETESPEDPIPGSEPMPAEDPASPDEAAQVLKGPKDTFYPSTTKGWGLGEPYIYTVRFPEPILVTDPETGYQAEVLSLSVTEKGFLWSWRMPEMESKLRTQLSNQMRREVECDACLNLSDGTVLTRLYETHYTCEVGGVEYGSGEWNSRNDLQSHWKGGAVTFDIHMAESVTVQGVTYPLEPGPMTWGAKLWYQSDTEDLWNTKMVLELGDGTLAGFTVEYHTETVSTVPLPDEAALEAFGFDRGTWLEGHTPMKAGTLYYAHPVLVDAYTVEIFHDSPISHCDFYYDLVTGELTVTQCDGDDPVPW